MLCASCHKIIENATILLVSIHCKYLINIGVLLERIIKWLQGDVI